MHDPWPNRSKNESYWIFRILQHAEQIANMYACSSIIQFSWIIKLYFAIKSDWVSCCSWDFLASHQTCRQNCSNSLSLSLSLSEISSCHLSVKVFLLYWAFSFWSSQLLGPECNKRTGQDKLGPHHVHNPSRGMSNWFLLFWKTRKGKGCASHAFVFSKEIKGRNPELDFSSWTLEHLTECRVPDAVVRWSAKSSCKDSLKCEKKGQWHLHISESSADVFQGSKSEGLMKLLWKQSWYYLFIYLLIYGCMYLNPDFP